MIRSLQIQYPRYTLSFIPIIIWVAGYVPTYLEQSIVELRILEREWKSLINTLQMSTIFGTIEICKILRFKRWKSNEDTYTHTNIYTCVQIFSVWFIQYLTLQHCHYLHILILLLSYTQDLYQFLLSIPDYEKNDCGPPEDVAGAVKVYRSTNFRSIVTYNCPRGGVFKSTCEKDEKWSPVPPACEGNVNSFPFVVTVQVFFHIFLLNIFVRGRLAETITISSFVRYENLVSYDSPSQILGYH